MAELRLPRAQERSRRSPARTATRRSGIHALAAGRDLSLAGRVRPYHTYLPWELREHPLPDWEADELLDLLTATLDGDPRAIRATFERVKSACHAYDERCGTTTLASIIDDWGAELDLLRA